MKKVLVFGASNGGFNYIENQNEYEVVGIVDNDVKKHGNEYRGIRIYAPEMIKTLKYDYIVIASMYLNTITKQLKEDLKIDSAKILYAPKRMMKIQSNPFEDVYTLNMAKKMLIDLAKHLESKDYTYFINFGTLLGIVREGDLLAWDDDIDLAIIDNLEDDGLFVQRMQSYFNQLAKANDVEIVSYYKRNDVQELLGIDIEIENKNELTFAFSLDLLKIHDNIASLPFDTLPANFFEDQDIILLNGYGLKAPTPHRDYLTHVYQDWQVVKKNVTFEDNTTTYREPSMINITSETID